MVKIIGGKEFEEILAADAPNSSLFVDSSDSKLKYKNNAGTVLETDNSFAKKMSQVFIPKDVIYSGENTSVVANNRITDTSATFVSDGVEPGDIIYIYKYNNNNATGSSSSWANLRTVTFNSDTAKGLHAYGVAYVASSGLNTNKSKIRAFTTNGFRYYSDYRESSSSGTEHEFVLPPSVEWNKIEFWATGTGGYYAGFNWTHIYLNQAFEVASVIDENNLTIYGNEIYTKYLDYKVVSGAEIPSGYALCDGKQVTDSSSVLYNRYLPNRPVVEERDGYVMDFVRL